MVKYNLEVKLNAIKMYLSGVGSTTIARRLGIKNGNIVLAWVHHYEKFGIDGIKISHTKRNYTGEFKANVLQWKLENQASYTETALQFNISNVGTIAAWQKQFDLGGLEALYSKRKRWSPQMNKSQKNNATDKVLSELERLRRENRLLHVENEYLKKVRALALEKERQEKNFKFFKS